MTAFAKNEGRRVLRFGRWYIWTRNESGELSLVSMDRIAEAMLEVKAALATSAESDSP